METALRREYLLPCFYLERPTKDVGQGVSLQRSKNPRLMFFEGS